MPATSVPAENPEVLPPEQGQLVRVRNRLWQVQDALPHEADDGQVATRLELECLDDDRLGQALSVIWEREVNTEVFHADRFPLPSGKWDSPATLDAFLTAIRWSATSVLSTGGLLSPFRGAIELEPYQLEPAARAIVMPRVNLLIADDVGLGKTIEAGLVLQELLARARVRTCLVVCPASLQHQWQEEMDEKFNLRFDIIDRDGIVRLRREYGTHVNPWASFPRLITSIDFLKREQNLTQIEASLKPQGSGALGSWDLLILDEAHNCAPSGRQRYVTDSDRTRMLRRIAPHFQHRLFLTATPHNGFTESFTGLLEELDPLRFHRGPEVDPTQIAAVMVRRLKEELASAEDVHRVFARRVVQAIEVPEEPTEQRANWLIEHYIGSRLARTTAPAQRLLVQFALTLLRKRFLSSPLAFQRSLDTHLEHVTRPGRAATAVTGDQALAQQLIRRAQEDTDDDVALDQAQQEALRETTRFFGELTPDETAWLDELWGWSDYRQRRPDAKLRQLERWVRDHLHDGTSWSRERLIIFTEYRDTLEYLVEHLTAWLGPERVLTLTGGVNLGDREVIKKAFQADPAEHPVRVLIATDAAAEGLNLQNHCRYMVHYEIPWNPNRLEQRNGRIDRHGQKAAEVLIQHFVHANRADSHFLRTVVEKVETMRHDLGSVAAVIEKSIERFMLGERGLSMAAVSPRRTLRDDIKQSLWDNRRLRLLANQVAETRDKLGLSPEALRDVLDAALRLEGHRGLDAASGDLADRGALLARPPESWGPRCAVAVRDRQGRVLTLVFDPTDARDRSDVALVHLNHPLMQRALASFRKNMFSLGLDERLHRVTYEVVPDGVLPGVVVVATVRLLGVGRWGQKLHEELRTLAWSLSGDHLAPVETSALDLLPRSNAFPSIPAALGERLRTALARHQATMVLTLFDLGRIEKARAQHELDAHAASQVANVREMIATRLREIRKRLKDIEREMGRQDGVQLRLDFGPDWEPEEREQYQRDVTMLERRVEQLERERESEPARIRERFALRDLRAFPLALRVLLPVGVVEQGGW